MSLEPVNRSGAPHSSTWMWAVSGQMTASYGASRHWRPTTLAPVPPQVKATSTGPPNTWRNASTARAVQASAP